MYIPLRKLTWQWKIHQHLKMYVCHLNDSTWRFWSRKLVTCDDKVFSLISDFSSPRMPLRRWKLSFFFQSGKRENSWLTCGAYPSSQVYMHYIYIPQMNVAQICKKHIPPVASPICTLNQGLSSQFPNIRSLTFPETNSSHLKVDGWKTSLSF